MINVLVWLLLCIAGGTTWACIQATTDTNCHFNGYGYLGQVVMPGSNGCALSVELYWSFDNYTYVIGQRATVPDIMYNTHISDGVIYPSENGFTVSGLTVHYHSVEGNGSFTIRDGHYSLSQ